MHDGRLGVAGLTKVFQTKEGPVVAVDDVHLDVAAGEFFSLLGPSGCGKTTTLRMIAGLESSTSGSITFGGRDLAPLPSAARNLGMVFQSYALFPHLTVLENAAYGLRVRRTPDSHTRERVMRLLDVLGLGGLHGRYPSDLSGGQQQRVSIARALAYEPDMFLLDEPLANLDAKLRVQMREEIRRIQKELGVLALYVTHDQEEAMSVSDRLGIFNRGRLMQVGAPTEIYRNPTSLFVADFIGKINFFPAVFEAGGSARLAGDWSVAPATIHPLGADEAESFKLGSKGVVAVRPEHLRLQRNHDGAVGISGRVRRKLFLGSVTRYFVTCDASLSEVIVETPRPIDEVGEGDGVNLSFDRTDGLGYTRGARP